MVVFFFTMGLIESARSLHFTLLFLFSFLSYGPEIAQNSVLFANNVLTSARNLNLLKQFIQNHLKKPHHALLENSMFYKGLSNSSRDIEE